MSASIARSAFDPNGSTSDELARKRQWTSERFDKDGPAVQGTSRPAVAGLEVLANHDAVQKNARLGKPLKIGDVQYTRGLFGHAPSHIVVHLPSPGAKPHVRKWITERIDKLITEQGIDLYRQDFNMDPLASWRATDSPGRQGMTEIRHIEGYLAYWDELRRRHPDMLIDSCSGGGRRNDIETLRRAVPLLRSDAIMEPIGQQNQTYGSALWIPFYGTGIGGLDAYTFRSQMTPNLIGVWDMRKRDLDYDTLRRLMGQWRAVNANYYGDYYPLTPYAPGDDAWVAWQFDRSGAGMIQAFRRPNNLDPSLTLKLRGLDPAAMYKVDDLDSGDSVTKSGKELMETGLPIARPIAPAAALLTYERTNPAEK